MSNENNYLSLPIYRLNKLLRIQTQDALRKFNITIDQWIVLYNVYRSETLYSQRELARACFKESAAVMRIIDILEKKGLLKRLDSPADRRVYLISITQEGKELCGKCLQEVKELEESLASIFSKGELKQFSMLLTKLEEGLHSETFIQK